MCKKVKRFIMILTAISVMLTLTVSPVMGGQYSDMENALIPCEDPAVWEEDEAPEIPDEYASAEEGLSAQGEQNDDLPMSEARNEEQQVIEHPDWEEPAPEVFSEEQQVETDILDAREQELSYGFSCDHVWM